jgi:hypothetical protein
MPVQICTAGHPALFTVVTWSAPVAERPERVSDHSLSRSAKVANGLKLYLRLPPVPASARHGVNFAFLCRLSRRK